MSVDTVPWSPSFLELNGEYIWSDTHKGQHSWYVRGQNFVTVLTWAAVGEVLSEPPAPDEQMILVTEGSEVEVALGSGERVMAVGPALVVAPAGKVDVTTRTAGYVVRVFTARAEVAAKANALSCAAPNPSVTSLPPAPGPEGPGTLRVVGLADVHEEPGRLGRIYRSGSLMINWFVPQDGPRDTDELSPHVHDDFEQASLTLAGDYVHHLRRPWTRRLPDWRPDEHVQVTSPSVTLIPPGEHPHAGRPQPIKVMGEKFTIYRGASGEAVVTQAGCPHRQTMLFVGNVEGDSLRCMFHGWKFGADGQCQEAQGQSPSLVDRMRIKTYPTHEQYGVIFAYIGEGGPQKFPDIAGLSKKHGKDMTAAPVLDCGTYRRNCNYYINIENALNLAHVAYTHRLSSDPSVTEVGFAPNVIRIRDVTVERMDFGVRAIELEHDSEPVLSTVMLPNAMHPTVPQRDGFLKQVAWRVPIDDESHLSHQVTSLHTDEEGAKRYYEYKARKDALIAKYPSTEVCAEEILPGEKTLFDFADHPDLVNIEDHVAQMGIQLINDPGKENLAQSDKAVIQLRRMFMSRLADFVAGAPAAAGDW